MATQTWALYGKAYAEAERLSGIRMQSDRFVRLAW